MCSIARIAIFIASQRAQLWKWSLYFQEKFALPSFSMQKTRISTRISVGVNCHQVYVCSPLMTPVKSAMSQNVKLRYPHFSATYSPVSFSWILSASSIHLPGKRSSRETMHGRLHGDLLAKTPSMWDGCNTLKTRRTLSPRGNPRLPRINESASSTCELVCTLVVPGF